MSPNLGSAMNYLTRLKTFSEKDRTGPFLREGWDFLREGQDHFSEKDGTFSEERTISPRRTGSFLREGWDFLREDHFSEKGGTFSEKDGLFLLDAWPIKQNVSIVRNAGNVSVFYLDNITFYTSL